MSDNKFFRISQPYGYHMPDVEAAIIKYQEIVEVYQSRMAKFELVISSLQEENMKIKSELQKMNFEMSMLEIPNMDAVQEHIILSEFKNKKTGSSEIDEKVVPNPIQSVGTYDVPIVEHTPDERSQIIQQYSRNKDDEDNNLGFTIVE